jgi:methionine-rich copper-binding protein CopC
LSIAAVFMAVFFAIPNDAFAHAERLTSRPEAGADLQEAPTELAISFSEPPTGDSVVEVVDGCGNDLVQEVKVQNQDITAQLAKGQPGTWKVQSSVVSGVDGHPTKDSWRFAVAGEADCSQRASGQTADGKEDDGGDFPVIPVVIGAVLVLGVAVMLRVLTGRSAD